MNIIRASIGAVERDKELSDSQKETIIKQLNEMQRFAKHTKNSIIYFKRKQDAVSLKSLLISTRNLIDSIG